VVNSVRSPQVSRALAVLLALFALAVVGGTVVLIFLAAGA